MNSIKYLILLLLSGCSTLPEVGRRVELLQQGDTYQGCTASVIHKTESKAMLDKVDCRGTDAKLWMLIISEGYEWRYVE